MALDDLKARGLVAQVSDEQRLRQHLEGGARTLYCGFDPTAPSLHIGNLVPLLALRRFQMAGHTPVLLLGGATGLIGDPSGRGDERALADASLVAEWVERLQAQVLRYLDFEGDSKARIVSNLEWTEPLGVIPFLRDVGKHFSVNTMLARESVRSRLQRPEGGISYTEFSYMLLQAFDYCELARRYGCSLQIGGSDQWGNILAGVDLVRRRLGLEAHALTLPLVTRADGAKFGKTAAGAIWLDPDRTSPYRFYQFWLNTADADVTRYLRQFTLLPLDAIESLQVGIVEAPEKRAAQQRLADAVTAMVHGAEGVDSARRISQCLFGGDPLALEAMDLKQLELDGLDKSQALEGTGLLEATVAAGLAGSNGAARKLVQSGGLFVNGERQSDSGRRLHRNDALYGQYFLIRRGRKHWRLVVLGAQASA